MFDLQGSVTLCPVWWNELPEIAVRLDQKTLWQGEISSTLSVPFNHAVEPGDHRLEIEFRNKKDSDTVGCKDKAVLIQQIEFFGISDDLFVWSGTYEPCYPEPWFSQQIPSPPNVLSNQDRLSWNGIWRLEFTAPIFTWIHQVQSLGWIYD